MNSKTTYFLRCIDRAIRVGARVAHAVRPISTSISYNAASNTRVPILMMRRELTQSLEALKPNGRPRVHRRFWSDTCENGGVST